MNGKVADATVIFFKNVAARSYLRFVVVLIEYYYFKPIHIPFFPEASGWKLKNVYIAEISDE